jgi:hypothetical protein
MNTGIKASIPSHTNISCVSHHGPSFSKIGRAMCVYLGDEAQNGLAVSGVMRENAM